MQLPAAELFCCPITKQDLHFCERATDGSGAQWELLGERYALGNVIGTLETIDGGVAYPVWKDIFGLLPEFARFEETVTPASGKTDLRREKKEVARFYDEFGWVEGADGNFNDALAFEDLRKVTAPYRTRCHRRVNRFLAGGKYLLDVASGPVQIPEYKTFSQGYEKRICVDISVNGLLKAKERLGDHAICVVGDITALPLRTGAIDSFVSLHTVYHVPADEQSTAVSELYRVIKPGGNGVIVYSWGARALMCRTIERAKRWVPKPSAEGDQSCRFPSGVDLYFSPHDYTWYVREIAQRYPTKLRIWRSVDKESLEYFVRGRISATLLLWPLYTLEQMFPWVFGRIGLCPMFVINKPHKSIN